MKEQKAVIGSLAKHIGQLERDFWELARKLKVKKTKKNCEWLLRISDGIDIVEEGCDAGELFLSSKEYEEAESDYQKATEQIRGLAFCFRIVLPIVENVDEANESSFDGICYAYSLLVLFASGIQGGSIADVFSRFGKIGSNSRHKADRELKRWTLDLYKKGTWPSANKAAHALKDRVIQHGKTLGVVLSDENAQRTIADWIRSLSRG